MNSHNLDKGVCYLCGGVTTLMRPNHYQCITCDERFCRGCGFHHIHLMDSCEDYKALLNQFDWDEKLLLKVFEDR